MSPTREAAIKDHFNKKIRSFKRKALQIALKYDHPYIEACLEKLLCTLEQDALNEVADIRRSEKRFILEHIYEGIDDKHKL